MDVAVGVDPHKATLAAVAVDRQARQLAGRQFGNDPAGFGDLVAWAGRLGSDVRFGIEGSGSYGAPLARFLLESGADVREVPSALAVRRRQRKRSQGKSDPVDAMAIAKVVVEEDRLPTASRSDLLTDLKVLVDYHAQLSRDRTKQINRLHADLTVLRAGYKATVGKLNTKKSLSAVLSLIVGDSSVRSEIVRRRVDELLRLHDVLWQAKKRVIAKLKESASTLTEIDGVGPLTAARILGELGSISRVPTEAALARLSATAPIPASSGQTVRHRLDRGGNRQLNCAIHLVAVHQARRMAKAQEYLARKQAEGKTRKEAIRCLKRQLCKVIHRRLVLDLRANPALT
jgi:transposase